MDFIHIRDLALRCVIGVYPEERDIRQDVILNLRLGTGSVADAARTDRIEDTVDYKALKLRVMDLVENSAFQLIETLADRVAALCLEDPRVLVARVTVDKPGALRYARSVAVEVERSRAPA
jgi:dihydroneopterin aldolase/D-erythro-7,8-dihydroneopterin triphosphate epimerase